MKKGGHNISEKDVVRRFENRFKTLTRLIAYCDEISFYDNENGFVKVAEILNGKFFFTSDSAPDWIKELHLEIKDLLC